jgi:hypothetical protein
MIIHDFHFNKYYEMISHILVNKTEIVKFVSYDKSSISSIELKFYIFLKQIYLN